MKSEKTVEKVRLKAKVSQTTGKRKLIDKAELIGGDVLD